MQPHQNPPAARNRAMQREPSMNPRSGSTLARWVFVALVSLGGLLGLGMAWFGAQIAWLGGDWYYLLIGLVLAGAALMVWARRPAIGLTLVLLAAAATLFWALIEIAGKGWMPAWGIDLASRGGVIWAGAALATLAYIFAVRPRGAVARRVAVGAVGLGVLGALGSVAVFWERTTSPAGAPAERLAAPASGTTAQDWLAFGGTPMGQRFSALSQISTANVSDLQQVWSHQTRDFTPREGRIFYSSQNTPIKAGNLLYTCSASNQVFALNPATGAEVWHFDPQSPADAMESLFSAACRAVGYAEVAPPGQHCATRIYVTTPDGRLIARDALDGSACTGFGSDGVVDLTEGMGLQDPGFASNTSGVTVAGGLLLVGQQVSDNQRRDAPSGVVRAYDAASGELRWAWDALREDAQAPLAEGEIYPRGTPNVWNVISADEELGLAFLGTGNPGADHWGGDRTEREDQTTAAVIAVDLATGQERWAFATVIHDLWDYDIGAQPMLVDVPIDGATRRAVMQGTKTGNLFLLDAATGEPLRPVEQKPAPQGALPGEYLSPTQPQSVFYPNFSGLPGPDPEVIDARHTWGITPIDAAMCRLKFHQTRYEGMFTPPADPGTPMLLVPGTVGGLNWGGLGFDPDQRIVITNHSRLPNTVTMVERADVTDAAVGDGGARPDQAVAPQAGTPYGVNRPMWLSPLGVPCIAPPWGFVSATNIDTGELLWSRPLGTGYDTGPLGLPTFVKVPMGTANLGGPLVTAGGLTFIGAAQDNFLRGYETATGRLVWQARLDAGPQAGPMTYEHEGRQYLAIVNAGHARFETELGDALTVFALPQR